MSKGIINTCDFNISCKTCGNTNIKAETLDGYVYLICKKCEVLKQLKNKTNKIGASLLSNPSTENLLEILSEITNNNQAKAIDTISQISEYLQDGKEILGEKNPFLHEGFSI